MPFTVTHPLGRLPNFHELQNLAKQHEVRIIGDDQKGEFFQPSKEHPKVEGNYSFDKVGEIRGDFTGHHAIGKIKGIFVFLPGKAEVTVTQKPFFLPDALLKSPLWDGLKAFCAKFPPET